MEAVKQVQEIVANARGKVNIAIADLKTAKTELAEILSALKPDKPARKKPEPKTSKQIGPRMITTGPSAGRWRNPGSRLSWATQEEADRAAAGSTTAAAGSTTAAAD